MPPSPTWIAGRADVVRLFTNRLVEVVRDRRFRSVVIEANGQVGGGFYRRGEGGEWTLFAIQVLEAKHGRVRVIDHFTTESSHVAFFAGGLARTLAASG